MNLRQALSRIEKKGVLLIFPIDNRAEFPSLWSEFYPRTKMRWEWDENGDDRVPKLWHLRSQLAESRKIIYAKWFRGRATAIAPDLFTAFLRIRNPIPKQSRAGLSREAREILEILEMDSPLSTKELRRASGLQGKFQEAAYNRAMGQLWKNLLIVGTGEKDDGSFPSLTIAATSVWFEELWNQANAMPDEVAWELVRSRLGDESPFMRYLKK